MVSIIFQVSVPPAVPNVFPEFKYAGVVEIVLGALPSIVVLPTLLENTWTPLPYTLYVPDTVANCKLLFPEVGILALILPNVT